MWVVLHYGGEGGEEDETSQFTKIVWYANDKNTVYWCESMNPLNTFGGWLGMGLGTIQIGSLKTVHCVTVVSFLSCSDSSIDAPPSLKPPKKYADMSGLTVSQESEAVQ